MVLSVAPVCVFFATILAFGITAPVGSVILPEIDPRTVCADALPANARTPTSIAAKNSAQIGLLCVFIQPPKCVRVQSAESGRKTFLFGNRKRTSLERPEKLP